MNTSTFKNVAQGETFKCEKIILVISRESFKANGNSKDENNFVVTLSSKIKLFTVIRGISKTKKIIY